MRRHPEIAWSLDEAALAGEGTLPLLQRQILDAAATRVAPGGRLVYATCSVLPEENEQVIEAFLASDQGNSFELIPYTEEVPYLQTMPRRGGCDGHFCAVLQRRES
jgi:16S rRNA (cytosine967-C5)-methyltransferase